MRGSLLLVLVLLALAAPAAAQTATPTPSPTSPAGNAAATLAALPTYDALGGSPTHTPFPTIAWPTLTPVSLVPVPWMGLGAQTMTPGGPYQPPNPPNFDAPDAVYEDTANGFQAINDGNLTRFTVYLVDVAITFYTWFAANFPRILLGARWFVLIMMVLYGIFFIWKGSRFAPPDAERDANPRAFFFRTFRMGGRYYYYRRGARKADPDKPTQGRLL